MSDQKELISTIDTARKAKSILEDPLHIASLESLRQLTIEKFENLAFTDLDGMREAHVRLNIITEHQANYETMVSYGETAFDNLEAIQTFEQEQQRKAEM